MSTSTTTRHRVVSLDQFVKTPELGFEHDFKQYDSTSAEELSERIKDATIVITSATPVSREAIEHAPRLQLINCNGTGTNHIDKVAMRERGVTVCHVPAQNTASVSEHAFALYYAVRRHIVPMNKVTLNGKTWASSSGMALMLGKPPRTNGEETLIIVGYGALGQNVEKIGKGLGMKVMIAERKGATSAREGRVLFEEALKLGTLFILVAPLDDSTRNMISDAELESMDPSAIVVNVGRGGLINEEALAKALREGKIRGAGTDVFEHEPATPENCPLLDPSIPNLVVSPHIAWYSSSTMVGTLATVRANIEGFVAGKPQNVVV